jgi:ribosomal subunit interface protein
MKIQFQDRKGKISVNMRTYVQGRLGLALGRFGGRIERVNVRLSELSGEQCCQIEAAVRARSIRVEGLDADAHAAVDHAVSRVSSSVDRMLEREQTWDVATEWPSRGGKS